jgi:hypothetical protein
VNNLKNDKDKKADAKLNVANDVEGQGSKQFGGNLIMSSVLKKGCENFIDKDLIKMGEAFNFVNHNNTRSYHIILYITFHLFIYFH